MLRSFMICLVAIHAGCGAGTKEEAPAEPDKPDGGGCGDDIVSPGEACDDGNDRSWDGCDVDCRREAGWICTHGKNCTEVCGDNKVVGDEVCDPPGGVASCGAEAPARCEGAGTPYCSEKCDKTLGACGDGTLQEEFEECDDMATPGCFNCQAQTGWLCTEGICAEYCGNSIQTESEVCDDGNHDDTGYCSADCQAVIGACGDSIRQWPEECDDGNARPSDGCSEMCSIEYSATCVTVEGGPDECKLSGVSRSARIDSLTEGQIAKFCAWNTKAAGYPKPTTCGDLTYTPNSPEVCEEDLASPSCRSSVTIGEIEACVASSAGLCSFWSNCRNIACD